MPYLIDTNHCVYLKNAFFKKHERRSEFEINTFHKFAEYKQTNTIFVARVTIGELYFGAEKSEFTEKNFRKIEFFKQHIEIIETDDKVWKLFATTKAILSKQGKAITDFDLLIACSAKANDCILVSNDKDHRVIPKELTIENWAVT